jgi:hypothetical protein
MFTSQPLFVATRGLLKGWSKFGANAGKTIPIGIEEHVLMRFLKDAVARQKPQPYQR